MQVISESQKGKRLERGNNRGETERQRQGGISNRQQVRYFVKVREKVKPVGGKLYSCVRVHYYSLCEKWMQMHKIYAVQNILLL